MYFSPRVFTILIILIALSGYSSAQESRNNSPGFDYTRFMLTAGTKSYRSYTLVDNAKKIGPPYFTSRMPFLSASYIIRKRISEHRISLGYGISSTLDYDDGNGRNNVSNPDESRYQTVPVEYSYLLFVFRKNPNIAFGPIISLDYSNEEIIYKSSDSIKDTFLRTGIGINSVIEILMGKRLKFTAEYINQITIKSIGFGEISYGRTYSDGSTKEKYELHLTNSAVNIMLDYGLSSVLKAGIGFQWEEFFGNAKTSGYKLHDVSYRYLDIYTYIKYNF